MNAEARPVLVIGGGIAGMTAAVEAAEVGCRVVLVEKEAYLGGRVMRTHRYFPKMCPPTCGFEINVRRIRQSPRITVHTLATVETISGTAGDFRAKIKIRPRYVTGAVALDETIAEHLSSERPNDFNLGMDQTKALYLPHDMAYPPDYVLDKQVLSDADAATLASVAPAGSIDLEMAEEEIEIEAAAIIVATGWRPYDATKLENLGFGRCDNVITNVMMERLAAGNGPTGGEIVRPSDGKKAENVAFVQCAGSRDENHLPYCSAVCCMASLKQARYLRETNETAKATVFYIDIRTTGRQEKFYFDLLDDENISFVKGKVAAVSEDAESKDLTLDVEDTLGPETLHERFDMVVLATGVVPNTADTKIPFDLAYDEYGFVDGTTTVDGVYAVGCTRHPCDVSRTTKEATAAALKAIQILNRGAEEMAESTGVFICTGYGIAEALDVEALCKVVTDECSVPFCKTVDTCEGPGLEAIKADIQTEGLQKVLIAGISARRYCDHELPDGVIVEKVALREHVVWTQPPGEEDTQMLAEDYLRMYLAKLEQMEPLEPFQPDEVIDRTVLVVGGGVTGLTTAVQAATAGYDVQLVEKSDHLGGWLAKQYKSIPTKPPYRDLEDTGVDALISEVAENARIKVHLSAVTAEISGAPGLFDVTLKDAPNGKANGEVRETFRVGAVVQATGWSPTDPRERLSYGQVPDVIRNVELEEMVKKGGPLTRPSDGKEAKSIAFIQCGGSREKEHHSYCSSICCLTSLKQALYLRESVQDAKAYVFYEFMRTPGLYEDFYRRVQEDPGVFLTRGDVEDVTRDGDGGLTVTAKNTIQGEEIQVKVDLVVLAAGMVPNSADGEAIRQLEDLKRKAESGDTEGQRQEAAEKAQALGMHEGTQILNLDYRQGPDLPSLEYGFPDSHFICFPFETRRTGIYAAGAVRTPMDGAGSREDATGAALKAIQCIEMTSRGEAVHPRAGDTSYPDFFLQRCTQCKRCTEECPFGVLNEDEKGTPLLRATRCRRCGVCMGACPERIVSFKDYSVGIVASMIKAVNVPEDYEEKPRILALLCENDAFPALDLVGQHRLQINPFVRVVPVRCLGSVNSVWITEAISAGYDGVILMGCKYGDDYQCHFIKGSELAVSRGENIREKLQQMAMENERVEIHELQISDYERIPQIFADFSEVIETYGMNPFKGM